MQIFRHSMATCSITRSTKSQLIICIFDRFIFFCRLHLHLDNTLLKFISNCYKTLTTLDMQSLISLGDVECKNWIELPTNNVANTYLKNSENDEMVIKTSVSPSSRFSAVVLFCLHSQNLNNIIIYCARTFFVNVR